MRKTTDPHMRRYEIAEERQEALADLDKVLGEAREERIHKLLRLPEPIRKSDMTSANNRLMTAIALKRYLEGTAVVVANAEVNQEEAQSIKRTRALVARIVKAIERVGIVIAAEELGPDNDDDGEDSPVPPKAAMVG